MTAPFILARIFPVLAGHFGSDDVENRRQFPQRL
jgi:hypothetical protein